MSKINAGTTSTDALVITGDTTGNLILEDGGGIVFIGATAYGAGSGNPGRLVIGPSTGGTTRNAITFGPDGYGGPGAWNADSNGDKIVLWNNNADTDVRMGLGGGIGFWIKSMGSANGDSFAVFASSSNSGTPPQAFTVRSTGVVNINNLAGSGSRTVNASADGSLSAASDSSLKEEVNGVRVPGLTEILQIEPKAYKWKSDIETRGDKAAVEIGFFANDVAPIIPSAAPLGNDGLYGFYDRAVTAALVKAIQEQQVIIEDLKSRLTALEK